MHWQFGGNLEPVRIICEINWKECPKAIANYIWSEIVTDVLDCLTNEEIVWRALAVFFLCITLLRIMYIKARRMNDAALDNVIFKKVGCKIDDLELKINILTYKLQYGTWPLPHQIRGGLNKGLHNVRLTLSNPNDCNDWIKHVLFSPRKKDSYISYSRYDRSAHRLTELFDAKKKNVYLNFQRDILPMERISAKCSKTSSSQSLRCNYETVDEKKRKASKSENIEMQSRDALPISVFLKPRNSKSTSATRKMTSRPYGKVTKTMDECKWYLKELHNSNKNLGLIYSSSEVSVGSSVKIDGQKIWSGNLADKKRKLDENDDTKEAPKDTNIEENVDVVKADTEQRSCEENLNLLNAVSPVLKQIDKHLLTSNLNVTFCTEILPRQSETSIRTYTNSIEYERIPERAYYTLSTDSSEEDKTKEITGYDNYYFPEHIQAKLFNFYNAYPIPMDTEDDCIILSPTSSNTELSKGSESDDKSTAILLQEALQFKKALLTRIVRERPFSSDDTGTEDSKSEPASEPSEWTHVNNKLQSNILDIITEEQSVSSSTEKTSRTYIFLNAKQENSAEENLIEHGNIARTDHSYSKQMLDAPSEYFSFSDITHENKSRFYENQSLDVTPVNLLPKYLDASSLDNTSDEKFLEKQSTDSLLTLQEDRFKETSNTEEAKDDLLNANMNLKCNPNLILKRHPGTCSLIEKSPSSECNPETHQTFGDTYSMFELTPASESKETSIESHLTHDLLTSDVTRPNDCFIPESASVKVSSDKLIDERESDWNWRNSDNDVNDNRSNVDENMQTCSENTITLKTTSAVTTHVKNQDTSSIRERDKIEIPCNRKDQSKDIQSTEICSENQRKGDASNKAQLSKSYSNLVSPQSSSYFTDEASSSIAILNSYCSGNSENCLNSNSNKRESTPRNGSITDLPNVAQNDCHFDEEKSKGQRILTREKTEQLTGGQNVKRLSTDSSRPCQSKKGSNLNLTNPRTRNLSAESRRTPERKNLEKRRSHSQINFRSNQSFSQQFSSRQRESSISVNSVNRDVSFENKLKSVDQSKSLTSTPKTASRSCIPILRSRLEAARRIESETRPKSPMRGPLTVTMLWRDNLCNKSGNVSEHVQAEGISRPESKPVETTNSSVEKKNEVETYGEKQSSKKSYDILKSKDATQEPIVIYVNIFTKNDRNSTRIVDPNKFLEHVKNRELNTENIFDKTQAVAVDATDKREPSVDLERMKNGIRRIVTIVSSVVNGNDSSQYSFLDSSAFEIKSASPTDPLSSTKLKNVCFIAVEQREIDVTAKPSVMDTSTSISDLQDIANTSRTALSKFQICGTPKELNNDEYVALLEILHQEPNFVHLLELQNLCKKLISQYQKLK